MAEQDKVKAVEISESELRELLADAVREKYGLVDIRCRFSSTSISKGYGPWGPRETYTVLRVTGTVEDD